jgi:NAD(P)H-dependent FMN reductase
VTVEQAVATEISRHERRSRILGVCGSLQARSANLALLETAAASARAISNGRIEVTVFDGLRLLPHFNPDLEAENSSLPAVLDWRQALAESDAILIASPEYGHSLPGALKNAIDWVIGSGELYRKVVAITAAVPAAARGRRGLRALRGTLEAVDACIVGGRPIVQGPAFESEVRALLQAIVDRATSERAETLSA